MFTCVHLWAYGHVLYIPVGEPKVGVKFRANHLRKHKNLHAHACERAHTVDCNGNVRQHSGMLWGVQQDSVLRWDIKQRSRFLSMIC